MNSAIQLNEFTSELRYNYNSDGLATSYGVHGIVDGQPVEAPISTIALNWSDIAGVSTSVTPTCSNPNGSGESTTTYQYSCTTLVSAEVVSEFYSQPTVTRKHTIATAGVGKAVAAVSTLDGAGLPGRRLVFASFGNLTQVNSETIYYKPTAEQVINVDLFENALRYRGLI